MFDYETEIIGNHIVDRLQSPSAEHWFGTDELGRDVFARTMYGARYSLAIGVVAVIVSLVAGVTLGAVAGFVGGAVETGSWGLSFRQEGQPPVGPAAADLLQQYDAVYLGDTAFTMTAFWLNAMYVAAGELIVLYTLGWLLHRSMTHSGMARRIFADA